MGFFDEVQAGASRYATDVESVFGWAGDQVEQTRQDVKDSAVQTEELSLVPIVIGGVIVAVIIGGVAYAASSPAAAALMKRKFGISF